MVDKPSLSRRWEEFRPTKTALFWSCGACVAATMIVGFTWGGWVTGGSAEASVHKAVKEARAEVTAAYCTERFLAASDARVQLAALKELSSYRRRAFVGDTGFATLPGAEGPDRTAVALCGSRLAEIELDRGGATAEDISGTVQ